MTETQYIEKKSLKLIDSSNPSWGELAKECVAFANAKGGGVVYVGIEDWEALPPSGQIIKQELVDRLRKRIAELTVNVGTKAELKTAENGSHYIELVVFESRATIASTTDGRYYMRVGDTSCPLLPEDIIRLFTDKPAFVWETKVIRNTTRADVDENKLHQFITDIHLSDRVSAFVKEMSVEELLAYYLMTEGECLTNLGVLWIGTRNARAKLVYGTVVQFIKYDEAGNKVNKIVWDDFSLNPKELLEAIWTDIPDWKEGIEVSDGLFRKYIPNYEEEVVRELTANALVHRPYTTRGDVFINLYPDRLEIHNPGLLPLGVTPDNILHKTVKRNEHLAKVFYDLKLMEREGSGYDKVYEALLSHAKQIPIVREGDDRLTVIVRKQITKPEIIQFVNRVSEMYNLRQREVICLGLIAQHTILSAIELSRLINPPSQNGIQDWIGRLLQLGVVETRGRTKGLEYYIKAKVYKQTNFKAHTTLKKIEPHRLRELILQDLQDFPHSSYMEIRERIGKEIRETNIKKQLYLLLEQEQVQAEGGKKFRRYSLYS